MIKRKNFLSGILAAGLIFSFSPAASAQDTLTVLPMTDIFEQQNAIDEALLAETQNGYSFEEPCVILNPYGTSPLSAVLIFHTDTEQGGTITVKGKSPENDITGTFEAAFDHIVPVYGLYNGDVTSVELSLEDGTSTTVDIETEQLDLNFGDFKTEMINADAYDYSKLTLCCSLGGKMYAVDAAGDIRWYFTGSGVLGVHQLENGHLMAPANFVVRQTYYRSGLLEFDLSGKIYTEYAIPGGMHHDWQEMPNGNLLVASDSPDLKYVEDYVVEIDRTTGDVVWELDMKDLLDWDDGVSVSMFEDGSEEIDWYHNNSVWYDEANDLVLMSARHKDAIVAVNHSDKSLAWILGDPEGWDVTDESLFFTPVGDNFEWFYAQHEVTMLDNGDVMLFDNGSYKVKDPDDPNRVSGDDVYSKAVIYHLDTDAMTAEMVFEYGKERGETWYSDWVSGVNSLDGTKDNLWITAGSHLYDAANDTHDFGPADMLTAGLQKTTHIDQVVNGELAYELTISGESFTSLTFRSFRLDFYSEGSGLNVEATGALLGSLGETSTIECTAAFEDAQPLPFDGFTFTLDPIKLSIKGTYQTETAADALTSGYLILKNDSETRAYTLTQNAAQGDTGSNVSVSGWTSIDGLSGTSFEIYLVLDGILYETGYALEI